MASAQFADMSDDGDDNAAVTGPDADDKTDGNLHDDFSTIVQLPPRDAGSAASPPGALRGGVVTLWLLRITYVAGTTVCSYMETDGYSVKHIVSHGTELGAYARLFSLDGITRCCVANDWLSDRLRAGIGKLINSARKRWRGDVDGPAAAYVQLWFHVNRVTRVRADIGRPVAACGPLRFP